MPYRSGGLREGRDFGREKRHKTVEEEEDGEAEEKKTDAEPSKYKNKNLCTRFLDWAVDLIT